MLYVVSGAILCLSAPLIGHAGEVHPVLPWGILAGLFTFLGVLLLTTRSEEPVADWLVALNPFTRSLSDSRARRRDAVVCFSFALVSALAALATGLGLMT